MNSETILSDRSWISGAELDWAAAVERGGWWSAVRHDGEGAAMSMVGDCRRWWQRRPELGFGLSVGRGGIGGWGGGWAYGGRRCSEVAGRAGGGKAAEDTCDSGGAPGRS
jgi:hypothetical protein